VFLGAAPGVGKTTAMLTEGRQRAAAGEDVVVALVESHGRTATEALGAGFERVPLRRVRYRDTSFDELDVDGVLGRAPQVVLIDELAHSNVPGSRHEKRWQDVDELLSSGIDVLTNLNVSHVDSLNDRVETVTGVVQHETVPDRVAGGDFIGVHVREPSGLVESQPTWLDEQRRLLAELGGRYREVAGVDVARAVLDVCRSEGADHLVLGASRRTCRDEVLHGSVIERAIRRAGAIEVHLIPAHQPAKGLARRSVWPVTSRGRVPLPRRRRQLAWVLALVAPFVLTVGLIPVRSSVGISGALFAALLGVVAAAVVGGVGPVVLAVATGFLTADFFFTEPYYSLRVDRLIDIIGLVAFGVVGGIVGALVDILTRQGVQVAGARAEAEGLARLAAESLAAESLAAESLAAESLAAEGLTAEGRAAAALPQVAAMLRATFGLDSVSVLTRVNGTWFAEFSLGLPAPTRPEESRFSAELSDGRVLVLDGHPKGDRDEALLRAFVDGIRNRRERQQLSRMAEPAPVSSLHGRNDPGHHSFV